MRVVLVLALASSLVACGGTKEAEGTEKYADVVSETHNVSDMLARSETGRVVLDLREPLIGYNIEKGVDYSAIDVICPGDRRMNLERWVPELASRFQVPPAALKNGLFMYTSLWCGDPCGPEGESCHQYCENGRQQCLCP